MSATDQERWHSELRDELRFRYELLELEREVERLRKEARRNRDGPWLRLLRWTRRMLG